MIYGYCRVSSKGQLDNNSLEQQRNEISEKYAGAEIFSEQFTGKTTDRPVFQEVIEKLEKGDTLVVTKLDRFCRSAKDGLGMIEVLRNKGVNIHILNMGLIEDSPMGNLVATCLLAFAEFERSMIVERTQAGKEIAKQNPDFREGRKPTYSKKQFAHAASLKGEGYSYKQVEEVTGISKSTLYRYMKKNNLV